MIFFIISPFAFQNPISSLMIPGNVGFDPLTLSSRDFFKKSASREYEDILFDYREAELKHGRLAMLAAVAYPVQEVVNPILSKSLDLPNELALNKLSPSLVNGNLNFATLVFFVGFASGLELFKMNVSSKIPADYNWRVTEYSDESRDFFDLQAGEVWNGRVAMVATLGYVIQEAVTKMPVLFNV